MRRLRRAVGWTVGVILVLAVILRVVAFEVWTMPDDPLVGASTAPTLAAGDTLLVLRRGTPGFGELVRCPDPEDPKQFIIGRIAGVEGDTVEVEGRRLTVNGRTYEAESACSAPKIFVTHPRTLKETELACGVVPMGGGWHYRAASLQPTIEQKQTKNVPSGMLYLVSDNRAMPDDSRVYGLVPRESCKERLVFRLWSKAGWSDDKSRMSYIH